MTLIEFGGLGSEAPQENFDNFLGYFEVSHKDFINMWGVWGAKPLRKIFADLGSILGGKIVNLGGILGGLGRRTPRKNGLLASP